MIKKLKLGFVIIRDSILNLFLKTELHYIVEPGDWVIRSEGKQIINELKKTYKMKCKLTSSTIFMKSKIVIYGSINSLLSKHAIIKKNKINVLTLYHIVDKNPKIKKILKHQDKINIFHTACEITKKKLIKLGIPKEKIILIPEGIDLKAFNPKIESIKEKLKLPKDHIIIGSFQKDGVGWDEGLKPKMEKGPDILIEAIEGISKKVKVHILHRAV